MSSFSSQFKISPLLTHKKVNKIKNQQIGNYHLENLIGVGSFSKVIKGIHTPTGEFVAIKLLDKIELSLDRIKSKRMEQEISILKILNHKNIIKLYEIMETEEYLYLITEYCESGELFDYIVKKKNLTEKQSCTFFHQIIDAISYIHSKNISHRDIKPENLLLHKTIDGNYILKLIDFGISSINNDKNKLLTTQCGTTLYTPPEILTGEEYNGLLADIWSAGIVLYIMCFGYLPFYAEKEQDIIKNILECELNIPKNTNKDLVDLLQHLLDVDPKKRYDLNKIKKHKWYNIIKLNNNEKLINDINDCISNEVIDECCNKYGYDKKEIISSINNNKYDANSAIYYILLNKKRNEYYTKITDYKIDINLNLLEHQKMLINIITCKNYLWKTFKKMNDENHLIKKINSRKKESSVNKWLLEKDEIINDDEEESNDSISNRNITNDKIIDILNEKRNKINIIKKIFMKNNSMINQKSPCSPRSKKKLNHNQIKSLTPLSSTRKINYNKIIYKENKNEMRNKLEYKLISNRKSFRHLFYSNELERGLTPTKNNFWDNIESLMIKDNLRKKSNSKKLYNSACCSPESKSTRKKIKTNLQNSKLNILKIRKKSIQKSPNRGNNTSRVLNKFDYERGKKKLIKVNKVNYVNLTTRKTDNSIKINYLNTSSKRIIISSFEMKSKNKYINKKHFSKIKVIKGPIDLKCIIFNVNLNKIIEKIKNILNRNKIYYMEVNNFKFHITYYTDEFDIELFEIPGKINGNKLFYILFYSEKANKINNIIRYHNMITQQIICSFRNRNLDTEDA